MEDIHGEEVISLDPVYRKLGYLLEDGEIKFVNNDLLNYYNSLIAKIK